MHDVVDWKVLQLSRIVSLVEHQLVLVVQSIWDLVFLRIWDWRWWEYWVDRNFDRVLQHGRD